MFICDARVMRYSHVEVIFDVLVNVDTYMYVTHL